MNKQEFEKKYQDALIKVAIGVHVIETSGPRVGVDRSTMDKNIHTLCELLADGIGINVEDIKSDVKITLENMPTLYLQHPEVEQYIRELEDTFIQQHRLPGLVNT